MDVTQNTHKNDENLRRTAKVSPSNGNYSLRTINQSTICSSRKLFHLFEEESGGSWPPCLGEPGGPQEQVQQRTVEQFADDVPVVQILDLPVPQMVDQLVASLLHLDMPIPEQVIEVPKISSSSRLSGKVLKAP